MTASNRSTDASTVGVFPNRDLADDAAYELEHAGFRDIWVAVTRSSDANDAAGGGLTVVDGGGDLMDKIGRFFSGEGETGLADALRRHGVPDAEAARIEQSMPAGYVVLTAGGDPQAGASDGPAFIIERCGGRILTADYGSAGLYDFRDDDEATVDAGAGGPVQASGDEQRRLRLREERLSVDKERVRSGEARIHKRVVSEQQNIDVPTYREEIYIERRAVAASDASIDGGPISEGETIRVPLTEERLIVEKRPVVTEEIVIGKRRIEETQRVSETVRKEVVDVEDEGRDVSSRPLSDGGRRLRNDD